MDELRILDTYAEAIVEDIQSGWPVDTSTSRDAFAFVTTDYKAITVVIENDADYVQYIHRAGEPKEPPLYETLIPEIVNTHGPDMVAAMKAAVDRTERELKQATTKAAKKRVFAGVALAAGR